MLWYVLMFYIKFDITIPVFSQMKALQKETFFRIIDTVPILQQVNFEIKFLNLIIRQLPMLYLSFKKIFVIN